MIAVFHTEATCVALQQQNFQQQTSKVTRR